METIRMKIECPSCNGTGLYGGMGEGKGAAVICNNCDGTGAFMYSYSYTIFKNRKIKKDVKRVYLSGLGYKIGLGKINFSNDIGEIDMDKEGISYKEFLNGKKPKHIKKLGCPMLADQAKCHSIKGFTDECNRLNGKWISMIPSCKEYKQPNILYCWDRFERNTNINKKGE